MARTETSPLRTSADVAPPVVPGPVQRVREALLVAMESGEYLPGEALPSERILGEQFGVSRVSVREAIVGLSAVGLVSVVQGRGCVVSPLLSAVQSRPFQVWVRGHRDEIVELLKLRAVLDGHAAREAATNDIDTAPIEEAHRLFRETVDNVPEAVAMLMARDDAFHRSIALASDLKVLSSLLSELDHHAANTHLITMSTAGHAARSADQHDAILDAILRRDPDGAQQAASEHVLTALEAVLSLI